MGKDPLSISQRMNDINAIANGQPSIRSAFDMALYDLAAKLANMPLYRFLGGELRELRTDMTIGLQCTVEDTVDKAQKIIDCGFNAIKLKVGRPELQDVDHVAAVRELVGTDISIKIDANQGWSYPQAVANIEAMLDFNIQYIEQPLAAWDMDNLRRLRNRSKSPICADESIFDHHDAFKFAALGAVDYFNIKLGKSGGIHGALKINAIAEAAGYKCMIGCFSESRLALSAAAHLSLACSNIFFIDLDSAYNLKEDPVIGGVEFDQNMGGLLNVTNSIGHGAIIDESFLDGVIKI